jgi:V/A-type H+-transporting ATPase subunit C
MDISFVSGVMSGSIERLLSPSHLKSFENISRKDFLSLLKTHQYGRASESHIDTIMLEEELKHRQFLESLIDKNHLIFKVLYLTFDHLFLSNLMKSYHLGLTYNKFTNSLSNFNEERYEDYILNGVSGLLDLEDIAFLDLIKSETSQLDAQGISDRVIKILHDRIISSFNKKTDSYIKKYIELETTILNVMLLIRSIKYNKNLEYFEKNILSGGMIDKHILMELFDKSLAEIGNYLSLHFDVALTDTFKYVGKPNFLDILNDAFNVYRQNLLEDLSFQSLGFATVLHYTILKRDEMRVLKEKYYQIKE